MRTAKIMVRRDFGFGPIRQNHLTGEVCLTDVLKAGNTKRFQRGLAEKKMSDFLEAPDMVEYLETFNRLLEEGILPEKLKNTIPKPELILCSMGMSSDNVLKTKTYKGSAARRVARRNAVKSFPYLLRVRRGQFTGTWAHPFLTIKFAAWIDKEFEIYMHKTLYDGLLELRDKSGESYKAMCQAVIDNFGPFNEREAPEVFSQIGFYIQERIFGTFATGVWENASKLQLDRRDKIHERITAGAKWAAKGKIPIERFLMEVIEEG